MRMIALSGSYRKDGLTEQAVREMLRGAESLGWETRFIALRAAKIEFCLNCRACTQEPGASPGACPLQDDMRGILEDCLRADVLVLSSPLNFHQPTALMKRWVERLVCLSYWPWSQHGPALRLRDTPRKKAVLVGSCAPPGFIARLVWPKSLDLLKQAAQCFNAKVVKTLQYGFAAAKPETRLSEKALRKAYELGKRLAASS